MMGPVMSGQREGKVSGLWGGPPGYPLGPLWPWHPDPTQPQVDATGGRSLQAGKQQKRESLGSHAFSERLVAMHLVSA